jgi:hypothetical protein
MSKSKYVYDSSLKGKHSKFNQQLFEKYDIPARDKIKKALGEFVIDNPDPLAQDLVITDPKSKYKYIELQVCCNWVSEKFPYPNVYIYERKKKYGPDTLFITLDRNMVKGYVFDGQSYADLEPKRLKKYSREYIYQIKWCRVMPILIDSLTVDDIFMY